MGRTWATIMIDVSLQNRAEAETKYPDWVLYFLDPSRVEWHFENFEKQDDAYRISEHVIGFRYYGRGNAPYEYRLDRSFGPHTVLAISPGTPPYLVSEISSKFTG
jgi:hypothetical protein